MLRAAAKVLVVVVATIAAIVWTIARQVQSYKVKRQQQGLKEE